MNATHNNAKIALGTWSWGVGGGAGGDAIFGNHLDTNDLKEVVSTAMSCGLNLFDTAYPYANGESERILGELIAPYNRDSLIISDKFTPTMHNDEADNPVADMLEGSMERLGVDFIDIYWIHNNTDVERWTPYLADLVLSGKVGRVGVSNHSLAQLKRAQEILEPRGVKITAVQNHYSLLYQGEAVSELLAYCLENHIEFFSYMVLEQGALSGKYDEHHLMPADSSRGRTYNAILPQLNDLLEVLAEIAKVHDVTVAQVATAWAIAKGTTPILGVTKVEQVKDAAQVTQLRLSDSEMLKIEAQADAVDVNTKGVWEHY